MKLFMGNASYFCNKLKSRTIKSLGELLVFLFEIRNENESRIKLGEKADSQLH